MINWIKTCQPSTNPSNKLKNDASPTYTDIPTYRHLVGRLLYLTTTWPYITFITQLLSQFLTNSTINHYKASTITPRYLKFCPDRGIFFLSDSHL